MTMIIRKLVFICGIYDTPAIITHKQKHISRTTPPPRDNIFVEVRLESNDTDDFASGVKIASGVVFVTVFPVLLESFPQF